MVRVFYSSKKYRKKQSTAVKVAWKRGDFNFLRKNEERICKRSNCNNVFVVKPSDPKVFCSQSCAATVNNKMTIKRIRYPREKCLNCGKETPYPGYEYCRMACKVDYQYNLYVEHWKKGKQKGLDGNLGIVSNKVKRYLREKFKNRCFLCGWSEANPKTGIVPLVADHIDGNWQNNTEDNLRLLCPNCDSLTPTYGSLNRGKGRKNRLPSKRSLVSRSLIKTGKFS